jgi:hypothetical protein
MAGAGIGGGARERCDHFSNKENVSCPNYGSFLGCNRPRDKLHLIAPEKSPAVAFRGGPVTDDGFELDEP